MLTRILTNSEALCTFVDGLGLPLSRPQRRHMLNLADALLVCVGGKTLAALDPIMASDCGQEGLRGPQDVT